MDWYEVEEKRRKVATNLSQIESLLNELVFITEELNIEEFPTIRDSVVRSIRNLYSKVDEVLTEEQNKLIKGEGEK
jgi:SMC interacting uncharacterized protein involved in chromosome segregation